MLEGQHKLNPLRQAALKSELFDRIAKSERNEPVATHTSWIVLFAKPLPIALAIIACVLVSGGAALATENSLPGDFLHPLKLAAEKIETKLAVSTENKAELEAKHATQRVEEVAQLRNRAAAEMSVELKTNLEDRSRLAEAQAEAQVNTALDTLTVIQKNLDEKGNDRAAEAVGKSIERLKERATKSKLRVKFKTEHENTIHIKDDGSNEKEPSQEINKDNGVKSDDESFNTQNNDPQTQEQPNTETEIKIETEKPKVEESSLRSKLRLWDRN
jgi:hypothetical protein